jgi:hypothetical protein
VRVEHDPDCKSPAECDCTWHPYSFSTRHINYRAPSDFFDDEGRPQLWLRNKLRVGLAFLLSYYEHGLGMWYVAGTKHVPDARWDNVDCAGVLVWEDKPSDIGGKTVEERENDAAAFLECYSDWCNGSCYGYDITDADGNDVDSCWGFIGDDIVQAVFEALPMDATEENTSVEGEAAYMVEHADIFGREASKP